MGGGSFLANPQKTIKRIMSGIYFLTVNWRMTAFHEAFKETGIVPITEFFSFMKIGIYSKEIIIYPESRRQIRHGNAGLAV